MKIVLSGMRPTGKLHLGNYWGALARWLELQNGGDAQCHFMVADLHALTTGYEDTKNLKSDIDDMVLDWLAAGLADAEGFIEALCSTGTPSLSLNPFWEAFCFNSAKSVSSSFRLNRFINLRITSGEIPKAKKNDKTANTKNIRPAGNLSMALSTTSPITSFAWVLEPHASVVMYLYPAHAMRNTARMAPIESANLKTELM